ncbi:MAG: magnesium transporter CorA family protein [Chloroflexi bacterium]|nr:magnesium transporter CorA family protein [Chloroflexota bacterium]
MITILKSTERGLQTVNEIADGSWLNVIAPSADEVTRLHQELDVPRDFLTYPLDIDERARTEREDGAILIVLRIPQLQGDTADIPYTTVPLGIVLTDRVVVTACKIENSITEGLVAGRMRGLHTDKRNRFVLQLFYSTAIEYLSYLREINNVVERLEDELQRSTRNEELLELLKYQKSLVYFATGLRSNELMMERLQKSGLFKTYPEDADLLEDVLTENQQAIEMVGIANNILSQMMDAFASIISNNLNVVMKFLTSVTIVLSLPTMVASLYGMNVGLPLQNSPYAFLLIIAACLVTSLVVALIFWKRDWF